MVGEVKFKKMGDGLSPPEDEQYSDYINYLSTGGTKCIVYWIARYESDPKQLAHVVINNWKRTDFRLRFYSEEDYKLCKSWLNNKVVFTKDAVLDPLAQITR